MVGKGVHRPPFGEPLRRPACVPVPVDDPLLGVLWVLVLLLVVRWFTPLWGVLAVTPKEAAVAVLLHFEVGSL